jgi:hypothetical protein
MFPATAETFLIASTCNEGHERQPAVDTRGVEKKLEIGAGCHSRRRHFGDFGIDQALEILGEEVREALTEKDELGQ